jgi:hypothetical protein
MEGWKSKRRRDRIEMKREDERGREKGRKKKKEKRGSDKWAKLHRKGQ